MGTDQNWYKSAKQLEREKDTNRKIQMSRDSVSVSDSGQLVSILSLIRSEKLHDTLASADTNLSRVTPTGWERPRTRPLLEDTPGRDVLHTWVTWRSATAGLRKMMIWAVWGFFHLSAYVYNMHHIPPLRGCPNRASLKYRWSPHFDSLVGLYLECEQERKC